LIGNNILISFNENIKILEQNKTFENIIKITSQIEEIDEIIKELKKDKDKINGGYCNDKYIFKI